MGWGRVGGCVRLCKSKNSRLLIYSTSRRSKMLVRSSKTERGKSATMNPILSTLFPKKGSAEQPAAPKRVCSKGFLEEKKKGGGDRFFWRKKTDGNGVSQTFSPPPLEQLQIQAPKKGRLPTPVFPFLFFFTINKKAEHKQMP